MLRPNRSTPKILNFLLVAGVLLLWPGSPASGADGSPRTRARINQDWRFALGHASDRDADFGHGKSYFSYLAKTGYGDGPAHPAFDDRGWREVDLPHDWAVEVGFDPSASFSHGFKKVGPGFPENSVGWYRKRFHIPESDLGRRITVEFDGIYRDAAVFINGFYLGREASGYTSPNYDLTEYLNFGGENVLVVRVDASMEEGWYYEGAGIYRHVHLLKTDPLHVARYGTWVTTIGHGSEAAVTIRTTIENERRERCAFHLEQVILDPEGTAVAQTESIKLGLDAGSKLEHEQALLVGNPEVWAPETPNLYVLVTRVVDAHGYVADEYSTPFGIRGIRFDPNEGFFLNGRPVKLQGTNNHQDHAGIGTALPDSLQDYRIRRLKEMGSNAYRASHHPASPALLDACDRLGMLVIDENRLMGINDYHLGQLEHMILRDRNHPSVILWSIGNEEWKIEGNIKGARITRVMQDFVKRLDPTRPVTAAVSGGWGGISAAIDVFGVNYIRHGDVDRQHREFPAQIIIGTEETTTQATRGIYIENAALAHQPPRDDGTTGGNAESGWKFYNDRDYTAGIFYWTGFDYRGEPTPYIWPAVLSQFGILDNCGFPKDSFHYLRAWWTADPVLHVFPYWNWRGREGQPIEVRAHSNCQEVELFLNGNSLGRKAMPPNGHLAWQVPYQPGELVANGYVMGELTVERVVRTTGPATAFQLMADLTKIAPDGDDVAVVTLKVVDPAGDTVPTADHLASFTVTGPGRILGVGNGNPSSLEPDRFIPSINKQPLGIWTAPPAWDPPERIACEFTFDRPELVDSQSARLLLCAIGDRQTATLNGTVLFGEGDRLEWPLEELALQATGNRLQIAAVPFADYGAREDTGQIHPAVISVVTPAARWQRRAFNGLAQIIIQGTGKPGTITLHAEGAGLDRASVEIQCTPEGIQ